MAEEKIIRMPIFEANFLNDILTDLNPTFTEKSEGGPDILLTPSKKYSLNPELKQRFLDEYVGELWHSEKDILEYIVFYSTGEYFCQRKKLKYDFNNQSNYWSTYQFTGASKEQSQELYEKLVTLAKTQEVSRVYDIIDKIEKVDKEYLYYDQRYNKRVSEKNAMLAASDWRILPDVVDSYEGEKDQWIKWREELRKVLTLQPNDFESSLELLKYLHDLKWPIDPKKYKKKYPNNEAEYLSTDDQWVTRDTDASTDFVEYRLRNIMELRQRYIETNRKVDKEVAEMMKMLRVEDFVESGIDYTTMYTEEELDDLQNQIIE